MTQSKTIQRCQFQFRSADGLHIACARWDSRGPIRGIVQIAHGLGEHIGRYVALIEYFFPERSEPIMSSAGKSLQMRAGQTEK